MSLDLDYTKLLKDIISMKESINKEGINDKRKLMKKYTYLWTSTPTLFDMVYANKPGNMQLINELFTKANQVRNKELTHKEASYIIDDIANERILFPALIKHSGPEKVEELKKLLETKRNENV